MDDASHDARDRWSGAEFRVLDDSIANLLAQMFLAMGGMFLAYAAAEFLNDRWYADLDGTVGFVAKGLTFCVLGSLSIYLTSARPIRRALLAQRTAITTHEEELREQADRHELVSRLQAAFEMAENDHDAFAVVGDALGKVVDAPAELLLADSSRAHLRRVAVARAHDAPGCGVETPWSCPAVRRSRVLTFNDADDLDACPQLKGRGTPCSALCVPVTVLGTPMGVVHVTGPAGRAPGGRERAAVEAVAEQAGARVGVLRALAASELQATTDPLTGLLNRRSLEAELSRLRDEGRDFAIGFLDLDHFKRLNDTFGHEAGDRALRSFARLVRRAVRDGDLVCRYGGEEFVVVLPGVDAMGAEPMLRRISDLLGEAVGSGEIPPFTVSAGLADSTMGDDANDVIRHADEAMFRAKQAGRDRIVLAQLDDEHGTAGRPDPAPAFNGLSPVVGD